MTCLKWTPQPYLSRWVTPIKTRCLRWTFLRFWFLLWFRPVAQVDIHSHTLAFGRLNHFFTTPTTMNNNEHIFSFFQSCTSITSHLHSLFSLPWSIFSLHAEALGGLHRTCRSPSTMSVCTTWHSSTGFDGSACAVVMWPSDGWNCSYDSKVMNHAFL